MAREQHFNKGTVRLLGERVGYLCSNPDCRKVTIGPKVGELNTIRIGEAAHICAESPGGARFDVSMTNAERVHYDNGIWLCRNCHTMVDRDESVYSVEMLRSWKLAAENKSREEVGVKHPTNDDAINQLTTALCGALTPVQLNAISNIHNATNRTFESIDPRFKIDTEYENGIPKINVRAKEPVNLKFAIKSDLLPMLKKTIEHGEDLVGPVSGLKVYGTPLFDHFLDQSDGSFLIQTPKVESCLRMQIIGKQNEYLEMAGRISFGTKSMTYKGDAFGGLLSVDMAIPHDVFNSESDKSVNNNLSFSIFMKKILWVGRDINDLPFFERLHSIYTALKEGCISMALEYQGERIVEAACSVSHDKITREVHELNYVQLCRKVSRFMNLNVVFPDEYRFEGVDFDSLSCAVDIIEGRKVLDSSSLNSPAVVQISIPKELLDSEMIEALSTEVCLTSQSRKQVKVMGKELQLPIESHYFSGFRGEVSNQEETENGNVSCEIELYPVEGCEYRIAY